MIYGGVDGDGYHGCAAVTGRPCRKYPHQISQNIAKHMPKSGQFSVRISYLQHLEQLYVWKTDVSAKAVVRLRDRRKGMRVVFMPDMPAPMDEEETGRRRRR